MAKKKKEIFKHKFDEMLENQIAAIVIDSEYETAKSNQEENKNDFEQLVDILELKRTRKDYDWMADITLPEFVTILLTNTSQWVNQYFPTRDFVEVKLSGDKPDDEAKSQAAKKCINKTLNRKELYHYPKYVRGRTINSLIGQVYGLHWWEQETKPELKGYAVQKVKLNVDTFGNELVDETVQEPAYEDKQIEVWGEKIIKDHYNYEILDPRNVFTDDKYCYSVQQKDWVTIRVERTYEDLRLYKDKNQYFNLDLVKELMKNSHETDTAKETYRKGESTQGINKTPMKNMDVLVRFGKFWSIVEERDEDDVPIKAKPGIDSDGNILDDAEPIETIITYAVCNGSKVLIGFRPTDFIDHLGQPYKPLTRGWCYVHPTKDYGLSSGKYTKELQIALDDTFCMGVDRTKMATMPVFIGSDLAVEDNSSIFMEPEHIIRVPNPQTDLRELIIRDDIPGTLNQIAMIKEMMERVTSTYPSTMGDLPSKASTTATAIAGAESRTNLRANYEALTYEYTFLVEQYWMILQMTYRFAKDETKINLMGDKASVFSPGDDYNYTPVSSNIEMEHNKYKKLTLIDQFIGRLASVQNPNTIKLLNYLLGLAFELFGKEFPQYQKYLLDEKAKQQTSEMGNVSDAQPQPMSNQMGQEQSTQEQSAREEMTNGRLKA